LSYLDSISKQNHLARNIARISPISAYENVMSALAQSDLASFQLFMDNARAHRNRTIEYIRSKTDSLSLPSYFTICNEEDAITYEEMWKQYEQAEDGTEKQRAQDAWGEFRDKKKTAKVASLNLEDFPRFTYQPGFAKSLRRAIPDLMLLVLVNLLLKLTDC